MAESNFKKFFQDTTDAAYATAFPALHRINEYLNQYFPNETEQDSDNKEEKELDKERKKQSSGGSGSSNLATIIDEGFSELDSRLEITNIVLRSSYEEHIKTNKLLEKFLEMNGSSGDSHSGGGSFLEDIAGWELGKKLLGDFATKGSNILKGLLGGLSAIGPELGIGAGALGGALGAGAFGAYKATQLREQKLQNDSGLSPQQYSTLPNDQKEILAREQALEPVIKNLNDSIQGLKDVIEDNLKHDKTDNSFFELSIKRAQEKLAPLEKEYKDLKSKEIPNNSQSEITKPEVTNPDLNPPDLKFGIEPYEPAPDDNKPGLYPPNNIVPNNNYSPSDSLHLNPTEIPRPGGSSYNGAIPSIGEFGRSIFGTAIPGYRGDPSRLGTPPAMPPPGMRIHPMHRRMAGDPTVESGSIPSTPEMKSSDDVIKHLEKMRDAGFISNQECVTLAMAAAGIKYDSKEDGGHTTQWRPGGNDYEKMAPGTPLASFLNTDGTPSNIYGGPMGGRHARDVEAENGGLGGTDHAFVKTRNYYENGKFAGIYAEQQYQGSGGMHEKLYKLGTNAFGENKLENYREILGSDGEVIGKQKNADYWRLHPNEKKEDYNKQNFKPNYDQDYYGLKSSSGNIQPRSAQEAFPGVNLTAGMRNNNPGNIKWDKVNNWEGNLGPSSNLDEGTPQVVFNSPEMGMRAMAKNLLAYQNKDGINTIRGIMSKYSSSNAPAAIANISGGSGIKPDTVLDLNDDATLAKIMRPILTQEHGPASKAYTDEMIQQGIDLAHGRNVKYNSDKKYDYLHDPDKQNSEFHQKYKEENDKFYDPLSSINKKPNYDPLSSINSSSSINTYDPSISAHQALNNNLITSKEQYHASQINKAAIKKEIPSATPSINNLYNGQHNPLLMDAHRPASEKVKPGIPAAAPKRIQQLFSSYGGNILQEPS